MYGLHAFPSNFTDLDAHRKIRTSTQLIDFTQMFKSRSDTILKIQLRLKAHQTTALQVFLQFEVFKTAF